MQEEVCGTYGHRGSMQSLRELGITREQEHEERQETCWHLLGKAEESVKETEASQRGGGKL